MAMWDKRSPIKGYYPMKRARHYRSRMSQMNIRGPYLRAMARYKRNPRTGGFRGIEKKFFDTANVDTVIVSNGTSVGGEIDPATILCLNAVAIGTGEEQRIGRKISMHSVHIKGVIEVPVQAAQSALHVSPVIFLALYMDTQTNAAQSQSEEVFRNESGNAIMAAEPFLNLQNVHRFKVLKTIKFALPQTSTGQSAAGTIEQHGYTVPWEMFVKLGGKKVLYDANGTDAQISSIVDNSLHLVAFCTDTGIGPLVSWQCRLRYFG